MIEPASPVAAAARGVPPAAAIYRRAVLAEAFRLVSLVDRNPFSATRGSLSRTHWGWKFEDFPFPRMQEGVYPLVRLFSLADAGNPFHGRPDVAAWIEWAFEYWTTQQHPSGAFDEAYPYEQCLAATAFTSFYVGQAFQLHREQLPPPLRQRVGDALSRAGDWLVANDETHGILSNHLAVAVAALELVSRLSGDPRHAARARQFLQRILAHQSAEGWMREYDGADIGYGTHGFFYLAAYWQMTGCGDTLAALQRCAAFLAHFVHPDGTIGGEYASRNTEFYYPAGFEMLAAACPVSAGIAAFMRPHIAERRVCGVWAMDQFNFMPMLNNLLFAMDAVADGVASVSVPCRRPPFSTYFEECGLWVINRDRHYTIVGLSKGGTVSVFDKEQQRLAARHAGLVATAGTRRFTSQDYALRPDVEWTADRQTARIRVPWKDFGQVVFSPLLFIAFRLFNLTAGRVPAISRRLKEALVYVLISRKRRPAIDHQRTVTVADDTVRIADEITFPPAVGGLTAAAQFAAIHMGSAMYADVRAVEGSTDTTTWPVGQRVRLTGTLGLAGTEWHLERD